MKNTALIPQLRFPEFEKKWEKFEFSEIVKRGNKSYNPNKDSENFRCIELESLSQNTGQLLRTFDSINLKSNKTKFSKNEVLFGKLRPYLKKYLLTTFDGVCTSEIWVLKGKLVSNPFLYYLIQTNKFAYEANVSSGSKMPRTDWDYLSSIKFSIPKDWVEQQKIATFLTEVDLGITQLNTKKTLLEHYKKGVMQKIFNQEIRFKDDEGKEYPKWENKKLGKIGSIINGLTYSPNDINENGVLVLRSSNVQERLISLHDNVFVNVNAGGFNPVKLNDILICVRNGSKRLIGKNAIIKEEHVGMAFGAFMTIFRSDYNRFLFHFFDSNYYKKEVHKNLGATINSINGGDLKKFKVPFPCLEEQTKIANFLSDIDAQIQILTTQIENTTTFKKGLLQQMFV